MRFVAGRGTVAELLAEGAAAESHREEVANREHRSGKDAAGWGARFLIQQRCPVQKAFLQRFNC